MSSVHDAAQSGYSQASATYRRGRPEYPAEVDSWLTATLGLGPSATVVDLGAGTGKFTRRLVATGAEVIAVEPVAAMRAELQQALPQVQALEGNAAAIPLPDASVDVLVCAQSFHWFATEATLAEVARVLKPGGRFALIWNVRDERVDWVAAITEIITPYEGDAPRFYKGDWRQPLQSALFQQTFTPLQQQLWPHAHLGSSEEVIIARSLSVSFIAALPQTEQDKVEAALRGLISRYPQLRDQQELAFPYNTEAYWCQKAGS
ncbi:SAM-dependent methyltransferase [Pokkaliibacter plantistimulans]|uniref:SAM-dependent methyltransferase n=1 Tax=Proteobacteria bacterium 228 TaxID=2083153 RepID=A0A2S5KHR5_9PROT|nr:class I SAM-dependent methyltransferase [Pokkaliibacter plantistimulans]PPC74320.1 SAM-dependent methyltransferase [Pokkaliibacter plantistimulans]